jgi:cytochrome c oxidase subunit 4
MSEHNTLPEKHAGYVHVVPLPVLFAVFATLIVFTVLTVAATWYNLGAWNLIIAMAIATFKASLVVLYFMHLRYDYPFHALIFITALVFVALFISLTLFDTLQYQPDIRLWQQVNPPR